MGGPESRRQVHACCFWIVFGECESANSHRAVRPKESRVESCRNWRHAKTSDEKWNNVAITYWGTTDVVGGKGSQHGYFVNDHGADGRDWGTFEGKVAPSGAEMTVEGTWQYTGGDGKFKGLTGDGTFKTTMSSPRDVVATWQGTYQLASAKAHAR